MGSQPATEPLVPLSRERVLTTAVAFADRHGLESLSMRKLADELGAGAMSLYYHVRNKGQLLDGMVDIVFGEIELPLTDVDWKTAMRRRALSTREVLNRHRWAVGQMEGRTEHGQANLRLHDAVLGCLREAGFSLEMTVHAYSVQDAYIYGFALQESDMSSETADDFAAEAQRQMREYEALLAEFPYLVEVVGGYVAKSGYDYGTEFLFGLDLILDGLDKLRDGEPRPSVE
ncbi:MAG: TetR/AcrR family transcriptional regulator C-terminal domain-containing protein [Actinomycetota bacterium]|nr:TetR/AcrR family transcriptional regulator C-terminal domain-containing protein [Actinomycetota bacterium]